MRRKRGIARELLRKSRSANLGIYQAIVRLGVLRLDQSVLSKRSENLSDNARPAGARHANQRLTAVAGRHAPRARTILRLSPGPGESSPQWSVGCRERLLRSGGRAATVSHSPSPDTSALRARFTRAAGIDFATWTLQQKGPRPPGRPARLAILSKVYNCLPST